MNKKITPPMRGDRLVLAAAEVVLTSQSANSITVKIKFILPSSLERIPTGARRTYARCNDRAHCIILNTCHDSHLLS